MKTIVAALSLLAATVSGASAADLAARPITKAPPMVAPVATWTGWSVGLQAGWLSGEANHAIITDDLGFLNAPYGPTKIEGFNFGGVIGYDYQVSPNWVFGINTEFNSGSKRGVFDNGIPQGFGPGGDDIYESKLKWYGSVRGKVGFVPTGMPQLMIYGMGGLAYGRIDAANGDGAEPLSELNPTEMASGSATGIGYVAGGGLSWMLSPNVVLSAEGMYYDLGSIRINTISSLGGPHVFDVNTSFAVGRGVLSYKF